VFSEIYYDKGWNAYINGEEAPYFRANYLLRAMNLKAGNYKIEFKFEPASYSTGNILALISSILLLVAIVLYFVLKRKKKENA
jgi:LPXTG-motif cell wall-anchored protein